MTRTERILCALLGIVTQQWALDTEQALWLYPLAIGVVHAAVASSVVLMRWDKQNERLQVVGIAIIAGTVAIAFASVIYEASAFVVICGILASNVITYFTEFDNSVNR